MKWNAFGSCSITNLSVSVNQLSADERNAEVISAVARCIGRFYGNWTPYVTVSTHDVIISNVTVVIDYPSIHNASVDTRPDYRLSLTTMTGWKDIDARPDYCKVNLSSLTLTDDGVERYLSVDVRPDYCKVNLSSLTQTDDGVNSNYTPVCKCSAADGGRNNAGDCGSSAVFPHDTSLSINREGGCSPERLRTSWEKTEQLQAVVAAQPLASALRTNRTNSPEQSTPVLVIDSSHV
ncbi:hypothetical protein J6590_065073 [Homalodisca vitripennis]|nr:hypothetical protein J6590_065073 [Homalodisca vitripennis]